MGGLAGGIYAFFDGLGLLFFSFLIGGRRADRPSLRSNRVTIGGTLFGATVGGVVGEFFLENVRMPVLWGMGLGFIGGLILAGIVLGYVSSLEEEDRQIEFKKRIEALKAREAVRIAQKGPPPDNWADRTNERTKEKNRAWLVNRGIDPDDPQADVGTGCFIATAVFESPNAPEVVALRQWRNQVLLRSAPGRLVINLYCKVSPGLAIFIGQHSFTKILVRSWLSPFVRLISPRPI